MNGLGLKRCPFCGCKDAFTYRPENSTFFRVRCPGCGIDGPKVSTLCFDSKQEAKMEAKRLWNTRFERIVGVKHDKIIFDEMKEDVG